MNDRTSYRGLIDACSHDHRQCVQQALLEAERLCRSRKVRLTPLRRRVLELVWASHEAVKAYDLMPLLSGDGVTAKPPTVYRALDFLQAQGLIHRIESMNAYVGCPRPSEDHSAQLLICEACGLVEELEIARVRSEIGAFARQRSFLVRQETVEIRGTCEQCAQAHRPGTG